MLKKHKKHNFKFYEITIVSESSFFITEYAYLTTDFCIIDYLCNELPCGGFELVSNTRLLNKPFEVYEYPFIFQSRSEVIRFLDYS